MREISPAVDLSCEDFLECMPGLRPVVVRIRRQKAEGSRPRPSHSLIDKSAVLSSDQRAKLLDKVAELVDENLCGRSEMCQQFADLLQRALGHLGVKARIASGTSVYYDPNGQTIFRWKGDGHHWVVVGDECIDGNLDSLFENPEVPDTVNAQPYWGPKKDSPKDRKYIENPGARTLEPDPDVENIWWPELRTWLEQHIRVTASLPTTSAIQ